MQIETPGPDLNPVALLVFLVVHAMHPFPKTLASLANRVTTGYKSAPGLNIGLQNGPCTKS